MNVDLSRALRARKIGALIVCGPLAFGAALLLVSATSPSMIAAGLVAAMLVLVCASAGYEDV